MEKMTEGEIHMPIYRMVKVDVTHDLETQAIIGIQELMKDIDDPLARRRVLQYLIDRCTLIPR
jgi:hypothetical protein